jgi:hypothetical protein
MTTAQVTIDPVGENALIGSTNLTGTGKNTAAIYEYREVEGLAVFESNDFGGEFVRAVERYGA